MCINFINSCIAVSKRIIGTAFKPTLFNKLVPKLSFIISHKRYANILRKYAYSAILNTKVRLKTFLFKGINT